MRRLAPLVIWLLAVSLVALAIAEPDAGAGGTSNGTGGQGTVATNGTTLPPVRRSTALVVQSTAPPPPPRRPERRQRNRKRTTTTTTTTEPYDDDEEFTTVATTTVDPRTFDHSKSIFLLVRRLSIAYMLSDDAVEDDKHV